MSDKQVIDLTESFTLADHAALANIVIELDDSTASSSSTKEVESNVSFLPHSSSHRRRQTSTPIQSRRGGQRRLRDNVPSALNVRNEHLMRQVGANSPIDVVDYVPLLPHDTSIICLAARRNKGNRILQPTNSTREEPVRERSPINEIGNCPICFERIGVNPLLATKCGHVFCRPCLEQALHIDKKCPTCRQALRGKTAYHPLYLNRN